MRMLRTDGEWSLVYVRTAHALLTGQDIYQQPFGFTYPPFAAVLAIPFVWLGDVAGRFLWFIVSIGASAVTLRTAWRLAGGGSLRRDAAQPTDVLAVCLGLVAGLPFLLNALAHQQTDVVISALVLSGAALVRRDASSAGAVLLGLAAAIKGPALLFAPYLVWRRRIVALLLLLAVAVGANILPDLVGRPLAGHSTWLHQWGDHFLAPLTRGEHAPGLWATDPRYNQSVAGAVYRWTHTTWQVSSGRVLLVARSATPTTQSLRLVWAAAMGLLAAGVVWVLVIGRRRTPDWSRRTPWECALVLSAMLLCSPISSPSHFGLLLLPGFLLARAVVRTPGSRLTPALLVMLVSGVLANKDLVGDAIYTLQLWHGLTMWSAAAAVVGSACALTDHEVLSGGTAPDHTDDGH